MLSISLCIGATKQVINEKFKLRIGFRQQVKNSLNAFKSSIRIGAKKQSMVIRVVTVRVPDDQQQVDASQLTDYPSLLSSHNRKSLMGSSTLQRKILVSTGNQELDRE